MYVCVYVCMYVCKSVCMSVCLSVCSTAYVRTPSVPAPAPRWVITPLLALLGEERVLETGALRNINRGLQMHRYEWMDGGGGGRMGMYKYRYRYRYM